MTEAAGGRKGKVLAGATAACLGLGLLALVLAPRIRAQWAADDDGQTEADRGDDDVANPETGRVPLVDFDEFTTSLKANDDGQDEEHHVALSFSLEVRALADRKLVEDNREQIRQVVVEFFMDRDPPSLAGAGNLEKVKQSLMDRANSLLPGAPVTAVYLDDFIVR